MKKWLALLLIPVCGSLLFYFALQQGLFLQLQGYLQQTTTETGQEELVSQPAPPPKVPQVNSSDTAPLRRADFKPIDSAGSLVEPPNRRPAENLGKEYTFPAEFYPYRAMLSSAEQSAYQQIYANAMALNANFFLAEPLPAQSLEKVMQAVLYDNPALFWIDSSYQYGYTTQGRAVSVVLAFNHTADQIEESRKQFSQAAEKALAGARKKKSAVEKEKYIHDYLLDHVEYQLESDLNQSAYSALVGGKSVCAGYSRAFQYLMMELGVPTYYCVGEAEGSHAWNIIRLEDGFYHVDVAWNDPVGNPTGTYHYEYFNLTDAEISVDHTRKELSLGLPACNVTGQSYNAVFAADNSEKVRKGAQPLSYAELGYGKEDVVTDMDDYFQHCIQQILDNKTGTYTFELLLANKQLQQDIYSLTEQKEFLDAYVLEAATELGLSAFSAGVQLEAQELADGYYLLRQTLRLEDTHNPKDMQMQAASFAPES